MTTTRTWTLEVDDAWIAWLTFDQPGRPVNTFTAEAMDRLEDALDVLETNEEIKAVAIRSGKPGGFIAGADVAELADLMNAEDALVKAERGQAVFARIAALPVPVVAVIHGACMGGGLEMALACDYRLVSDDPRTSLGQPEVRLGIIPGWGGTQRLPRLVGLAQSLAMILTGKPVAAGKAARIGLADGTIAWAFAEQQTRAFIDGILTKPGRRDVARRRRRAVPRLMRWLTATAAGRALVFRRARRGVLAETRGNYPAPLEAIDVIRATFRRTSLEEGLAIEARRFAALAVTPTARNLVWLFEASRRLKKSGTDGTAPARLESAGVLGAGTMGAGIAWSLSSVGMRVRLHDVDWNAVTRGLRTTSAMYQALVDRRKLTAGEMKLAMHRIGGTVSMTGFGAVDVVIEAVPEDIDLKKRILREVEDRVRPETIICTNTSSLPLGELAGVLRNPKRFVGLHFFNPVNRMPLVEVAPCRSTSKQTLVVAAELVRRMGKTPVVVGDCAGFLVNRVLLPYLVESAWMFEEGVPAERLDAVLRRFGMPMGPLALADEVGIDVGYKVARVLEEAYGPRMRVAGALARIAESGRWKGRKSGSGFYVYGGRRNRANTDVEAVVAEARAEDGIEAHPISDEEIVDRAILIMVNEASRCLEEGVVADATALDMAMVLGTGFAPFRGGLLRYADALGLDRVKSRLDELASTVGDRFRPAPLIVKLARSSGTFHGTAA